MGAGAGAIININNQRGTDILIEEIKCVKLGSCYNTQFILGPNVQIEVGDFFCGMGSCDGCVVRQTAAGPPIPCYAFVEPIQFILCDYFFLYIQRWNGLFVYEFYLC